MPRTARTQSSCDCSSPVGHARAAAAVCPKAGLAAADPSLLPAAFTCGLSSQGMLRGCTSPCPCGKPPPQRCLPPGTRLPGPAPHLNVRPSQRKKGRYGPPLRLVAGSAGAAGQLSSVGRFWNACAWQVLSIVWRFWFAALLWEQLCSGASPINPSLERPRTGRSIPPEQVDARVNALVTISQRQARHSRQVPAVLAGSSVAAAHEGLCQQPTALQSLGWLRADQGSHRPASQTVGVAAPRAIAGSAIESGRRPWRGRAGRCGPGMARWAVLAVWLLLACLWWAGVGGSHGCCGAPHGIQSSQSRRSGANVRLTPLLGCRASLSHARLPL